MKFLRSDHKIEMRHAVEKRVAARLRHAPEKSENHFRSALGDLAHHPHFSDRLLVRHVAHAAGVEEDHVRFAFVRDRFIAARDERMRDLFGIAFVHLAAVGFNEELRHGGTQVWHSPAGRATVFPFPMVAYRPRRRFFFPSGSFPFSLKNATPITPDLFRLAAFQARG